MTNAEKYKEVFGMDVDLGMCPTNDCDKCPCHESSSIPFCYKHSSIDWWNKEYKEKADENS